MEINMKNNIGKYILLNGEIKHVDKFLDEEITEVGLRYYEVIRIIKRKPLFLKDHLDRLIKSLENENISLKIKELIKENVFNKYLNLVSEFNDYTDCNIKIVINVSLDKYVFFINKFYYPNENEYKNGVKTVSYLLNRKMPNKKVLRNEYINKIKNIIQNKKVFEVILLNEKNYIFEGSRSNVFFIKGESIITTPDSAILKGVTRKHIIKCFLEKDIKIEKRFVNYDELSKMDGIFITGTSIKILPVCNIDDIYYDVKGNKFIKTIISYFNDYIEEIT
jgi:branched-chain amino acid aminotransferase